MFSGLIGALGVAAEFRAAQDGGGRLAVRTPAGWTDDIRAGDSIAVDGVCLTAVVADGGGFAADLSAETLACCAPWREGAEVNLERSLAVGDKLGGHFVGGHAEGVARLLRADDIGGGRCMRFAPPPACLPFVAVKGSVALSGVSLTVNAADETSFAVQLIPHTLLATTLGKLAPGAEVNIETDMLARYAARAAQFFGGK